VKRESGRVHFITIFGIVGALLVIGFFFSTVFAPATPEAVASRFLDALARGDTKTLTETSFIPSVEPAELEKKWVATMEVGKYYRFIWRIQRANINGDTASVVMGFTRDSDSNVSYEENLELPLEKVNGQWKVSVSEMDNKIFPALPR
jgi:hypothetical protein